MRDVIVFVWQNRAGSLRRRNDSLVAAWVRGGTKAANLRIRHYRRQRRSAGTEDPSLQFGEEGFHFGTGVVVTFL